MPPKAPPPNAMWADWVQEASDQASAKGSKAADSYGKAARSIRNFKEQMHHPSEAQSLQGVGPKVVDMITRRLEKWCKDNHEEMPQRVPNAGATRKRPSTDGNDAGPAKKKSKTKEPRTFMDDEGQAFTFRRDPMPVDPNDLPGPSNPPKNRFPEAKKAAAAIVAGTSGSKGTKTAKAYVPRKRSGGWGILVALYSFCTEESQKKFRTKGEIIEEAQEYCDSSYTVAETAKGGGQGQSSYITCWQSMKQLVTKGYVVETNTRPKQWAITRQGFEVAELIAKEEGMKILQIDLNAVTAHCGEEADVENGRTAKGKGKARAQPAPAQPAPRSGPSSEGAYTLGGSNGGSSHYAAPRRAPNVQEQRWVAYVSDELEDQEEAELQRALALSLIDQGGPSSSSGPAANPAFPNLDAGKPKYAAPPLPASKGMMKRTLEAGSGEALNGSFAATGAYARNYKEQENTTSNALGNKPFEFYYLDIDNKRTKDQKKAQCAMDSTLHASYKIEFRHAQSLHPFASANITNVTSFPPSDPPHISGPEGTTQIGWLAHNKAVPAAPGFVIPQQAAPASAAIGRKKAVNDLMMGMKEPEKRNPKAMYTAPPVSASAAAAAAAAALQRTKSAPAVNAVASGSRITGVDKRMLSSQPDALSSSGLSASASAPGFGLHPSSPPPPPAKKAVAPQAVAAVHTVGSGPGPIASGSRPRGSFATAGTVPVGQPKPRASVHSLAAIAATVQPEIWPVGSYYVVLVLDNRETAGQKNRQGIAERCGDVLGAGRVQQRALAVGDALWIASHRALGKEVVLDEALERKRLDDLCSSIKDQRFHEQKARLKRSGLKSLTYLVEDFDRSVHQQAFGQQIWTSKTQVMVVDGFHLHQTRSWKESADYLILKTQVLADLHGHTSLSVIPDANIDRGSYLGLLQELRRLNPAATWVTSYNTFAALNDKSATLTVSDVWARMVACLSGMSAEKIGPLVDRWTTPRDFWEAYKERRALAAQEIAEWEEAEREREQRGGKGKGRKRKKPNPETWIAEELPADYRGIGPALSKKMWNLWDTAHY